MDAKEFLTIVSIHCPSYKVHLPDCPLTEIRAEGDPEAIRQRIRAMTDNDAQELVRRHFLCVCRKNGCGT